MSQASLPSRVMAFALCCILLAGCEPPPSTSNAGAVTPATEATPPKSDAVQKMQAMFVGCYSVNQEEAPQIKISAQADSLVMQMREPTDSTGWDTPEPLETLPLSQVAQYFSVDGDAVTGMIGRPDRMLVIAHVSQAYVNINPLLDSEYLGFIYKGANTIFKAECDTSAVQAAAGTAPSADSVRLKPVTP